MGNPKQKWTPEEEEALRAGIDKHGVGKWKNIQQDPEFNHLLYFRSNIDLKDKWRNLSVSATGQGSRTPKPKSNPDAPAAAPLSSSPALAAPTINCASAAHLVLNDKSTPDGKNAPVYNNMILDALSVLNDSSGSDTGAIVSFIEKRHDEVPQCFRRLLSTRLRRLVAQEKIEKVQNRYKLKRDVFFGTKTPVPKQKDVRSRQVQSIGLIHSGDTIEEAAIAAAYRIAEAENKSFVASEAVKEAERVSKMVEDSESVLYLAKEIFETCSRGEIVLMA